MIGLSEPQTAPAGGQFEISPLLADRYNPNKQNRLGQPVAYRSRLEDWPDIPVARIGFSLNPDGFFERNPALDLPPSNLA